MKLLYYFVQAVNKVPPIKSLARNLCIKYPKLAGWVQYQLMNYSNQNLIIDRAGDQEVLAWQKEFENSINQKSGKIILILSTFPFQNPTHGGQIRYKAIKDQYVQAGYHCILFIIRDEGFYINESEPVNEIIFPAMSAHRLYQKCITPCIVDFTSGIFAVEDNQVMFALARRIKHKIDVIHVEQPWLFKFAIKIQTSLSHCQLSKIIYGSQNIEYQLKEQILSSYKVNPVIIEKIIAEIKSLEILAAKKADITQAVSQNDKQFLEEHSNRKVILSPNGAYKRDPEAYQISFWRDRLPKKFLVFIASAHPPNIFGILSVLKNCDKFLSPEIKIVVIGSINDLFTDYKAAFKENNININFFIKLGKVDEESLAAILFCAHAVLIPITIGGGTNLKTAEALLSGKYVISTEKGFRGYEQCRETPGVYISQTPADFQTHLETVWRLPSADFDRSDREDLIWENALAPLIKAISS